MSFLRTLDRLVLTMQVTLFDVARYARALGALGILLLLDGCVLSPLRSNHDIAEEIALPVGLLEKPRQSGSFLLTTRERIRKQGADVTIYIEGDGAAWLTRTHPSRDPTPDNPIALRLATADPADNVAWVARPCQYTSMSGNTACGVRDWTSGRFSEKAVDSIDGVVSAIKQSASAARIHLVGYSGGGGIAVLLAARRNDVASIRTVGANLDHKAFTSLHHISPMSDSLNPADVAESVQMVPQLHFIGDSDKVIPEQVARSYLERIRDVRCTEVRVVSGIRHDEGWESIWKTAVSEIPAC